MAKHQPKFPRALLDRTYLFSVLAERKRSRSSADKVGKALRKPVSGILAAARSVAREEAEQHGGRFTAAEKALCTAFVREWERYGPATYLAATAAEVEDAMDAIRDFAAGQSAPASLATARKRGGGPLPKLTEGEVAEIRARWEHRGDESALTKSDVGDEYGVSVSIIDRVLSGMYTGRPD